MPAARASLDLTNSVDLLRRAATVDATMMDPRFVWLVNEAYPLYGERGRGAYVWDVDGNRYLDLILSYGTVILGHADPCVSEAVLREIRDGFMVTVRKRVQVELAELLTELVPSAERVMFLKTGSDATSAAIRLSRAFTGREHVIRWGYHGWHDWSASRPTGVPTRARELVSTFDYNDIGSLEKEFQRAQGGVACLIMMPFELDPPDAGFLAEAADLAHHHGALFVLDEIRSGFRMALGGAQQRYGLRPDLSTFSKAMANGYGVSAVVGAERVMRRFSDVHIGSAYNISGIEMAAAVATITTLRTSSTLDRIERLGERLMLGLGQQVAASSLPVSVLGVPQMPYLRFEYSDDATLSRVRNAFYAEAARAGVLLHPYHHWFISAAMSEHDVDTALNAVAAGFAAAEAAA